MANTDDSNNTTYQVVVNDEEQYSIWHVDRDVPAGWQPDGMRGSKAQCLAHITRVWTDIRPVSLRRRIAANAETAAPAGRAGPRRG